MSRPKYSDLIGVVKEKYESGLAVYQVAEELGLSSQTVSNWLKRAGVRVKYSSERRAPEESLEISRKISQSKTGQKRSQASIKKQRETVAEKTKDLYEERSCEVCSEVFSIHYKAKQRFCSKGCANTSRRTRVWPVCPCGKDCPTWHAKYCSRECKLEYGRLGRPSLPVRTSTCLGCGEEFSRPASYPSKMRYCSNECAHRERRKVRDKYVLDMEEKGALIIRSLYELRFIAACERFGIEWRSYDGTAFKTSVGNYRPDFIISVDGEEQIVEVKGWADDEALVKSRESGVELFLIEDLERFEETGLVKS